MPKVSIARRQVYSSFYDIERDIGVVPWDYSDDVLVANTTKLNAALAAMWAGGDFTFKNGSKGPVLRPIWAAGKTFYFRPPLKTTTRIGSVLIGVGGDGYIMTDYHFTPNGSIGGMRTRFVGINPEGINEPVIRLRGCGDELRGIEFYGRRLTGWNEEDKFGEKAIACIQCEGGFDPYRGVPIIRDCHCYEATYGIQTLNGYYNDQGAFVTDPNHADLGAVEHCAFYNVNSALRLENPISIGWVCRDLDISVSNMVIDTIAFDVAKGGILHANGVILDHNRVTLLSVGKDSQPPSNDTSGYTPFTNRHNIQNVYWDRMPDPSQDNYLTLFKYAGPYWHDSNLNQGWDCSMSGIIADNDSSRYDKSRLIEIRGPLGEDEGIVMDDMYFDFTNLPMDDFTSAYGPWAQYTPGGS